MRLDGAFRKVPQRVTALEAPRRMEWTGGLPFGLFAGRRTFTGPAGNGTGFRFEVRERAYGSGHAGANV